MQDRQAVEQHLIAQTAGATRVGVVFVHGIGQQSESSTVREFGGPLLHWLQEWHQRRDGDLCVASSDLTYGELAERPARFSLELAAIEGHPAQTWILAEAWWAARLSAPNLDEMTWWGLKSAVVRCLRLAELVVTSFRNIRSPKDVIELVSSFLLFLGYVAAAILSIPLILGLFVLAQIPGPVEQAVMGLRSFFLDQIGDFYTFMWDDIQAVHIRGSVAAAIHFLVDKRKCERIAVVAHSQGSSRSVPRSTTRGTNAWCPRAPVASASRCPRACAGSTSGRRTTPCRAVGCVFRTTSASRTNSSRSPTG